MREPEMEQIGDWITEILSNIGRPSRAARAQASGGAASGFPIYEARLRGGPARIDTPTFSPTENPWARMNILKETAHFLAVAGRATPIIRHDLAPKHQHMTKTAFPATFYR